MDTIITHTVLLFLVALLQLFNLFLGFACLPLGDYRLLKKKGSPEPFLALFRKHLRQALEFNRNEGASLPSKEGTKLWLSSVQVGVILFVHLGALMFLLVALLPPEENKWKEVRKTKN